MYRPGGISITPNGTTENHKAASRPKTAVGEFKIQIWWLFWNARM